MGIRSEALIPGRGDITATVDVVEHLGSESLLYAMAGKTRIVAKVSAGFNRGIGEAISFTPRDSGVHFFFQGSRIERSG